MAASTHAGRRSAAPAAVDVGLQAEMAEPREPTLYELLGLASLAPLPAARPPRRPVPSLNDLDGIDGVDGMDGMEGEDGEDGIAWSSSSSSDGNGPRNGRAVGPADDGSSASLEEIRRAYHRKARELHPDRNAGREAEVLEEFQRVQQAYEVLSDPRSRAAYDRFGESGVKAMRDVEAAVDDFLPARFAAVPPWKVAAVIVSSWSVVLLLDGAVAWPLEWFIVSLSSYFVPKPLSVVVAVALKKDTLPPWVSVVVHGSLSLLVYLVVPTVWLVAATNALIPVTCALVLNLRHQNWDSIFLTLVLCAALNLGLLPTPVACTLLAAYSMVICLQVIALAALVVVMMPPEKWQPSYVAFPALRASVVVVGIVMTLMLRVPSLLWLALFALDYVVGLPFEYIPFGLMSMFVVLSVASQLAKSGRGALALIALVGSVLAAHILYFSAPAGLLVVLAALNNAFFHFVVIAVVVQMFVEPHPTKAAAAPAQPLSPGDNTADESVSSDTDSAAEATENPPISRGILAMSIVVELLCSLLDYWRGGPPYWPYLTALLFIPTCWSALNLSYETYVWFRNAGLRKN